VSDVWKRVRRERLEAGLCEYCGEPVAPTSRRMCKEHLAHHAAKAKERIERLKAEGRCVRCGRVGAGSVYTCGDCQRRRRPSQAAVRRRRVAAKKARGECIDCHRPPTRGSRCEACYQRNQGCQRAWRRRGREYLLEVRVIKGLTTAELKAHLEGLRKLSPRQRELYDAILKGRQYETQWDEGRAHKEALEIAQLPSEQGEQETAGLDWWKPSKAPFGPAWNSVLAALAGGSPSLEVGEGRPVKGPAADKGVWRPKGRRPEIDAEEAQAYRRYLTYQREVEFELKRAAGF